MRRHPLVIAAAGILLVLFSFAPLAFADFSYGGAGGAGGVKLQATTPGTAQTGNVNLSGAAVLGGQLTVNSSLVLSGGGSSTANSSICGGTCAILQMLFSSAGGGAPVVALSGSASGFSAAFRAAHFELTPGFADASLPSCNGITLGALLYSTTKNAPRICDGNTTNTWKDLIVSGPTVQQGAISVAGVTIGPNGTAITNSPRGTAVWNPGTIAAGAQATTTITVTGAATGADCIAGVVSPAPLSGHLPQCIITAANTCSLSILNQSAAGTTLGSATFYCRAFNP